MSETFEYDVFISYSSKDKRGARTGEAAQGRWPECHLGQGKARAGADAHPVHVPGLL
jgi:hypothetical protein